MKVKIKAIMSGYQDPYSGIFGEPGAWNWPLFLYLGAAGLVVLTMLIIFVGFDNDGFLHKLERRFGIKNKENPAEDDL